MAEGKVIRLGLVGVGKIARDQHLPAIAGEPRLELAGVANPGPGVDGVPSFASIEELLAHVPDLDAISIATPPGPRHGIAVTAIAAGKHVMLEKPPAATLSAAEDLRVRAEAKGVTLFASWHARAAHGVAAAKAWLAGKPVKAARIAWREDIRHWHPGQEWILGPAGFGVFDPGINALSIATEILPDNPILEAAKLEIPQGRVSPLRAHLALCSGTAPVTVELDFLQTGTQTWDIEVDTDAGTLKLSMGGAVLELPGQAPDQGPDREYATLYGHFADLIEQRRSDVDVRPLRLVADAFLIGDRTPIDAFAF